MKAKTSITLSSDVLAEVDALTEPGTSRSAFIEKVLRTFLARRVRAERDARELECLNRHAAQLNAEAGDVLTYQAPLSGG